MADMDDDNFVPRALMVPVTLVAITALSLGYDAGVMSGALLPISNEFQLDVVQQGLMMGALNLCAAPGALLGSWAADLRGRVAATAGTAVVLIVGPLIIAFASNFIMLMLGRVVTGFGVGFAFVIPPLYAAELAPPVFRGRLIVATEVLINVGVVLGYLSSTLLHARGWSGTGVVGWRLVTGLAALPPLLVLVFVNQLPESPRWLAKQQRWGEVNDVLKVLCKDSQEVKAVEASIREAVHEEKTEAGWGEVLCPSAVTRRMLVVGLGVAFFQQACGSEAMVYYSPGIIGAFGVDRAKHQNQSTILIGVAKLLGAILGGPFLDAAGRRPGVLVSCGGCAGTLMALALCLQVGGSHYVALLLLCGFMVFFELGLAPAAFVLGTESYPVTIRAKAFAMGMFLTRLLSGIVSTIFPAMVDTLTLANTFWVFAGMSCVGVVWAWLCVPETKGLQLEEVARLFDDKVE